MENKNYNLENNEYHRAKGHHTSNKENELQDETSIIILNQITRFVCCGDKR